MPDDLALQVDISVRLVLAAALGAAIGFEREIHEHPAGMRTHLLVSLGAAAFTVAGIVGFGATNGGTPTVDPSRVAAQVVSGIGFLGGGAILKYGTSIRGLTTAASLWATAAIGLAVGAGAYLVGAVGTVIVIVSLWPLQVVVRRLGIGQGRVHMLLHLDQLESLGKVTNEIASRRVEIVRIQTQRRHKAYEIDLDLRFPGTTKPADLVRDISSMPGVEVIETAEHGE